MDSNMTLVYDIRIMSPLRIHLACLPGDHNKMSSEQELWHNLYWQHLSGVRRREKAKYLGTEALTDEAQV